MSRTKNVGAPWLSRSLVSGRPRQTSRIRSSVRSRSTGSTTTVESSHKSVETERLQRLEVVSPLVRKTARGEQLLPALLEPLLEAGLSGAEQLEDRLLEEAGLPALRGLDRAQLRREPVVVGRPAPLEPEQRADQVERRLGRVDPAAQGVTATPGLE